MTESPNSSPLAQDHQPSSPRSVEVVGMLGDSVVSVRHLAPARKVRSKRPAFALLAAGALLLVVAVIAFAKAVGLAAVNQEALRVWTEVQNLPAHEFRPQRLGWVYDYLAFGGLGGGLLAVGLGLARLRSRRLQSVYRVGRGSDVDFATEHAPEESFPLVEQREQGAVVTIPAEMEGDVDSGGVVLPLEALIRSGSARPSITTPNAWELSVPEAGQIRLSAGPSRLLVRAVEGTAARLVPPTGFDARAARFFAASALAHIALVAAMSTIPADPRALALQLGSGEGRVTHFFHRPAEYAVDTHRGEGAQGQHEGAARQPGGIALPDSDGAPGKPKIAHRSEQNTMARIDAMDRARDMGVAGVLRQNQQLFADFRSMSDFSSGPDAFDYWGNGNPDGSSWTGFGDYRWGTRPGPGGPGDGIIAVDRYTTVATDDLPWDSDGGPGTRPGHHAGVPDPQVSDATVVGGLDKALVRRHIKRRLPAIKYCYERALLVNKNLAGTVVADFLVDGKGVVLTASAHGMDDEEMESCIAEVIEGIQFPRPADGSSVQVRYPFHFRQSGM